MEPMTLGSPSTSPAKSPYLPAFLLGESTIPKTPKKCLFSQSPPANSTPLQDFIRSNLGQKTQQEPNYFPRTTIKTGPPTQGLFDSLRQDQIKTPPTRNYHSANLLLLSANTTQEGNLLYQSINNSYNMNATSSFNTSGLTSPGLQMPLCNYHQQQILHQSAPRNYSHFWITVYGFPQSATSMILSHFLQCGTIVDKIFPPQGGNWMHLKFSSRLESDRALNYNEKILGNNNIMIGVANCKDSQILEKENICDNNNIQQQQQIPKVRPLSQVAYNIAQNYTAVPISRNAPKRNSGLVNKAMDLLFGW